MKDDLPYFSVVITTYNRAHLIKRAIESLIRQTIGDWEAIIIDDGSTDNTTEIVLPYLTAHRNLRLIRRKPQGATPAKNEGMMLSRGRFIAFLDSDDEYAPDFLEVRKRFLQQHPAVSFLHGGVLVIGDPLLPDRLHPGRKIHVADCAVGGSFIIAQKVFQTVGSFEEMPLGSDSQYLERVRRSAFGIAVIPHKGYIYHREGGDSITNNLLRYGWMAAQAD